MKKIVLAPLLIIFTLLSACGDYENQVTNSCAESWKDTLSKKLSIDYSLVALVTSNHRPVQDKDIIIMDISSEWLHVPSGQVMEVPIKNFNCYTSQEAWAKKLADDKQRTEELAEQEKARKVKMKAEKEAKDAEVRRIQEERQRIKKEKEKIAGRKKGRFR